MSFLSRTGTWWTLLVVVLILWGCGGGAAATPTPAPTPTVDLAKFGPNVILIIDSGFEPKSMTLKLGESVTFVNRTSQIHQPTGGPMFGGGIMPNGTWTWKPRDAETFEYVDYRFPDLKGKITVVQP